jgi:hypothetical protein
VLIFSLKLTCRLFGKGEVKGADAPQMRPEKRANGNPSYKPPDRDVSFGRLPVHLSQPFTATMPSPKPNCKAILLRMINSVITITTDVTFSVTFSVCDYHFHRPFKDMIPDGIIDFPIREIDARISRFFLKFTNIIGTQLLFQF